MKDALNPLASKLTTADQVALIKQVSDGKTVHEVAQQYLKDKDLSSRLARVAQAAIVLETIRLVVKATGQAVALSLTPSHDNREDLDEQHDRLQRERNRATQNIGRRHTTAFLAAFESPEQGVTFVPPRR